MGGLMPPLHGRSFPALPEPLRLSRARRLGAFSRLLARIRSDESFLEAVDGEGLAFLECETRSLSWKAAPDYWLCDVVRVLDAIDEEKTRGES